MVRNRTTRKRELEKKTFSSSSSLEIRWSIKEYERRAQLNSYIFSMPLFHLRFKWWRFFFLQIHFLPIRYQHNHNIWHFLPHITSPPSRESSEMRNEKKFSECAQMKRRRVEEQSSKQQKKKWKLLWGEWEFERWWVKKKFAPYIQIYIERVMHIQSWMGVWGARSKGRKKYKRTVWRIIHSAAERTTS